MGIYAEFCEKTSVLFSTDVASRGLDFPEVDWVVQVDCPEDVPTYIHRVGRTARFTSEGKSVLFLLPSEKEMITKLQSVEPKIPIKLRKANTEKLLPISGLLSSLLVKYPDMQGLAKRAFETYLKSIKKQRDKEVFDVFKLPIEDYAASLGLPMTPKIRFINQKGKGEKAVTEVSRHQEMLGLEDIKDDILLEKKTHPDMGKDKASMVSENKIDKEKAVKVAEDEKIPKIKMKKLKINMQKPLGTRVKFDDDGHVIPPLAALADTRSGDDMFQPEIVNRWYEEKKNEMKLRDKEDKVLQKQRLREKRTKNKMKMKRAREEEGSGTEDDPSELDEEFGNVMTKRTKIFYASDEGEAKGGAADSLSVKDQEDLALKLLSSMHS